MTAAHVLALFLLACSAFAAVYWLIVWMRMAGVLRNRPTIRAGESMPEPKGGWPKLSVIIPAHNEEEVIDACCQSLREQQYPQLEIIFVLDRCADRTAEIVKEHAAADDRIVMIENDSCPDDWAGKCHAAHLGAQRATGEYVLFTDADTHFDPALCRSAVAIAKDRDLGLLSLLTTLTCTRLFERIAQPVATLHLMRIYPPIRHRSGSPPRPFANGQFMLFARQTYESIGGHAAVKNALLEDLAFAKLVRHAGGGGGVLFADGMLRCDMYESLPAFRTGWKRIFIEACRRRPKRLRSNAWRILFVGLAMPLAQIAALILTVILLAQGHLAFPIIMIALVALGWIIQFTALARIYSLGGAPMRAVIYYPLGCWIVAQSMLEGARDLIKRTPVRWGGREYILEPRT